MTVPLREGVGKGPAIKKKIIYFNFEKKKSPDGH